MQSLIQKQKNILTVAIVAALSVSGPRARGALEKHSASTKPAKAELPQLQLSVNVPSHWRPFLSDDLAEAFASRLTDVFCQRGYAGEVQFLDRDDPRPDAPVLVIRLINWRIGRTDKAQCIFGAALKNAGHEHDLGLFENTGLAWNDRLGRWGLADALGNVADRAIRDLSDQLSKDSLLPGFSKTTV